MEKVERELGFKIYCTTKRCIWHGLYVQRILNPFKFHSGLHRHSNRVFNNNVPDKQILFIYSFFVESIDILYNSKNGVMICKYFLQMNSASLVQRFVMLDLKVLY